MTIPGPMRLPNLKFAPDSTSYDENPIQAMFSMLLNLTRNKQQYKNLSGYSKTTKQAIIHNNSLQQIMRITPILASTRSASGRASCFFSFSMTFSAVTKFRQRLKVCKHCQKPGFIWYFQLKSIANRWHFEAMTMQLTNGAGQYRVQDETYLCWKSEVSQSISWLNVPLCSIRAQSGLCICIWYVHFLDTICFLQHTLCMYGCMQYVCVYQSY